MGRRGRGEFSHRCDRHAGTNALKAVDDDGFTGSESFANDALAVDIATQFDGAVGDHVVLRDGENVLLTLVGADCAFANQQGVLGCADRKTHPGKKSGNERAVPVRKHHADGERAGGGIHVVVHRFDETMPRIIRFILELHVDRHVTAFHDRMILAGDTVELQQSALIDVGVDINVAGGDDGREQRGVARRAGNEIARK